MARPRANELTERELEVMQQFWEGGQMAVADVQQKLDAAGRSLAYTTVATLVRILVEKGFLKQTSNRRPHLFKPRRSFQEVSGSMLRDLVTRVFGGSHEALLVRLMQDRSLSEADRQRLIQMLRDEE